MSCRKNSTSKFITSYDACRILYTFYLCCKDRFSTLAGKMKLTEHNKTMNAATCPNTLYSVVAVIAVAGGQGNSPLSTDPVSFQQYFISVYFKD